MPSNNNFVCFDCRLNVRRFKLAAFAPRCPHCRRECTNLGYKIPIPSKTDLGAWQRLFVDVREAKRRFITSQQLKKVGHAHGLERQIAQLESRRANPGRERTLRELRQQLQALKQ